MTQVMGILFDDKNEEYIKESGVKYWKETLAFIINKSNKMNMNNCCEILINKL
jgi:hypothetical protein